jgi:Heterokaryon incompatibility protein (HET)
MPYSQLDRNSRSLRLLILSPNLHPEDNRIQCRHFITSLDSFPSYDALSYMWGQPDDLNLKIWVNGFLVPVRRNLLCALRVLRGDVERVLWIDALCINQNDEQERSHQVEMMGEIYKMAYWVLAWLGTPELGEPQDKIDVIGHQAPSKPVLAFDFLEVASQRAANRFSRNFIHYQWMNDFVHNPALNAHWKELAEICSLEYWTRLWIIQEVCLASKLRVLYGTEMIDWTAFWNFHSVISLYPLDRQDGSHLRRYPDVNYHYMDRVVLSQPWKLVMYRRFEPSSPAGGLTLKSLLELSMACSCHDKKDKVYGILGLASDVPVGEIPVDYSQSLFQLYTSVMRFMLRKVPRYSADAILIPFS